MKKSNMPDNAAHIRARAKKKAAKLTAGQKVKVFQKPLTDEQPEGVAMLYGHSDRFTDSKGHERWEVRFEGETRICSRIVHARNIV